jgi:predicted Zn-dependent protease
MRDRTLDRTPRRLFADADHAAAGMMQQAEEAKRYMLRADCEALFKRVVELATGGGEVEVNIDSRWVGNLRWARNRVSSAGDTTNHTLRITRIINGARGDVSTNKFDDAALKLSLQTAERLIRFYSENPDAPPLPPKQQYLQPQLWSDASYNLTASARSETAKALTEAPVTQKLVSAGYMQTSAFVRSIYNTTGMDAYYAATQAEYSTTIRNPSGTGSGWAGVTKQDWTAVDAKQISATALKKCVESADPRAVEPGRYTLIMEPQAVHDMFIYVIYNLDRYSAENMQTVFTLRPGQSKIGLKVFDDRITVGTDPMDPGAGYIPFDYEGYPYRAVNWVEKGVLRQLSYNRRYALSQIGDGIPLPNPYSYRMSGGDTSIDEMIASTERGLLVTRLSSVNVIDNPSLLMTGVTRDGLWPIEKGKVKFSVKNFRFTDSPMFAFNNVEQLGRPERVYGYYPTTVPPVKVRDFNFTSLSDAV